MARLLGFLIFIWVSGPVSNAAAQQIVFQFQVYKMGEPMADALQERLLGGGKPAVQAMEKMPDMDRNRRAKLEAELEVQATSGQRVKGSSSDRMLTVNEELADAGQVLEVVDGLGLEIDPVIGSSGTVVDVNLAGEYSERSRNGAKLYRLTTSVAMKTDQPILLSRWQEGEEILMFVGSAKTELPGGAIPGAVPVVYIDAAFYESAADVRASREPVARALFPSRSGQRARSEMVESLSFDAGGGLEMVDLGLIVEVDSVLDDSGAAIDLNSAVQFNAKSGGSERLVSGERVPKVEMRTVQKTLQLQDSQTEIVDVEIHTLGNRQPEPDDWKASLGFRLLELK